MGLFQMNAKMQSLKATPKGCQTYAAKQNLVVKWD